MLRLSNQVIKVTVQLAIRLSYIDQQSDASTVDQFVWLVEALRIHFYDLVYKQRRKRPLDTPKRKIERRESEGEI